MGLMQPVTVAELIEHLKQFDPAMPVCYDIHSEQCLLELCDVYELKATNPRPDGWVQNLRPDEPSTVYLRLP